MPCLKELPTRHRWRWRYSVGISELLVRRVYIKASSSAGRLIAFSHSSEDFGGHAISVLFERTTLQMYSPTCYFPWLYMESALLSNCWDKVTISLASWTFEKFWERTKTLLLFGRSSNCNKSPKSFSNFLQKCLFRWFGYFSSAHWSHGDSCFSLRSTIVISLRFNKSDQINSNSFFISLRLYIKKIGFHPSPVHMLSKSVYLLALSGQVQSQKHRPW